MKQSKSALSIRTLLTVPMLALALALCVNFLLGDLQVRRDPALSQALRGPTLPAEKSLKDLSDSLLTDSILSIIQSYYVDQERVDNNNLLLTALSSLSASPRVQSGADEFGIWIEVDDHRRNFKFSEEPRYQDLLEVFSQFGAMLDDAGVTISAGDSPEKNAPGSVVLLNALLAELDAHSALLSPEAYKELRQGTEGSFGGLGVLVGIRDNLLTVIRPLPRSPALRAGIRKNDRILSIDGKFTYGYSLDDLVEYMRGDPGTDVNLSLLRDGFVAPSEITLKREVIQVDSVAVQEIEKDGAKILHLTIENFSSRTSREVLNAIKKSRQKYGGFLAGLVLDLRSNPGGLLDQAVQVADLFLQQGVIVTTKGRREEVESAGNGFDELEFPVVVLVDGDSASASEIVAGALQDHGRAVIIGQPSFGKGSVQTIFELPGERALKLTIARYYTPAGRSIQNIGIIPDIWLQPIFLENKNENLFGSFRYKNERFLRNHLEDGGDPTRDVGIRWSSRKAYYVANTVDGQDLERGPVDREMEMAVAMISRLFAAYGSRLPDVAQRASHWLGMAGPTIGNKALELDDESRAYLQREFSVSWEDPRKSQYNADVQLKLEDGEWGQVRPGQTLRLKWKIHNYEEYPVERISVYVRSDIDGFATKEVLIGGVKPHGERQDVISVQIPTNVEPGPLMLRVGLAIDAWPAKFGAVDVPIQILARPVAKLEATIKLVEEMGGRHVGEIEGFETGTLAVSLKNIGDTNTGPLVARVINLAGSQIKLEVVDANIEDIAPGSVKNTFFTMRAGKTVLSDQLAFGLLVEAPELKTPLRQRFTIKSRINSELSRKMPGVITH